MRRAIVEMLFPTLLSCYYAHRVGPDYTDDDFRIWDDGDVTYVEFVGQLPPLEIGQGSVMMCAWELDLHNPKFASLLKARVTRCLNNLDCKCKYYQGSDDE